MLLPGTSRHRATALLEGALLAAPQSSPPAAQLLRRAPTEAHRWRRRSRAAENIQFQSISIAFGWVLSCTRLCVDIYKTTWADQMKKQRGYFTSFFFFNSCQKDPPKMPPNPAFSWKASLSIMFWSILFPLQSVTFCWKLWWRTYVCGKLHPWEILELLHSVLLPKALR